jgi:trigger factor
VALIDFVGTVKGEKFDGGDGKDVSVDVSQGELIEGNMPQLDGVKVGERKQFDYAFPTDYRDEALRGVTATFNATVKSLKTKLAPAVDDAFAKSLGFEDLASLKARVRNDLTKSEKNRIENEERQAIFEGLIAKNPFECPNALIEHGVNMLLEAAFGSMMQSGVDPRTLSLDWNSLRQEVRPRAEREARGQLVLEGVARQEKLEVSDDELRSQIPTIAEELRVPVSNIEQRFADASKRESLRYRVLEDKAMALVKSHVKYE